jgi:uncharacterized protein
VIQKLDIINDMKVILQDSTTHVLRFDNGDDVIAALATYCTENSITAGHFSAIGSAGEAVLAYYNLPNKQFEDHTIQEEVEIVSLTGNVATMDGKTIIHAHGVLSRQDLSTIAGHFKKLTISATAEVVLTKLNATFTRHHDEQTGLNLLSTHS